VGVIIMASNNRQPARKLPFGLEDSVHYEERARQSRSLAESTNLPRLKQKHLDGEAKWLEFAARARKIEQGRTCGGTPV